MIMPKEKTKLVISLVAEWKSLGLAEIDMVLYQMHGYAVSPTSTQELLKDITNTIGCFETGGGYECPPWHWANDALPNFYG